MTNQKTQREKWPIASAAAGPPITVAAIAAVCALVVAVTISQGRVIHHSVVRPGVLAKLLVKGVTKHPDDVGYSDPRKMQVAIMQAGWWRMLFAMIIGATSRLVLRRRGDFYRIAGHRISEIDGFSPATVKPFDEFAMLGPANPDAAAEEISAHMGGAPVVIVDFGTATTLTSIS